MTEAPRPRVLFGHGLSVIRGAVTRVLRAHGFAVEAVADGHDARDRLAEGGIDAFVVDVAMPGVLGYELVADAREPHVATSREVTHRPESQSRPVRRSLFRAKSR